MATQATGAIGGTCLLAASALPWSGRGAGASIALRRVGDLILSGALEAWVPRSAGLVVYAIPLGGALLLVGAGLGGRPGIVLSGVAGMLAAAGTILVVTALDRLDRAGSGPGLVLGMTGAMLAVATTVAGSATMITSRAARPGGPPPERTEMTNSPPDHPDGDTTPGWPP